MSSLMRLKVALTLAAVAAVSATLVPAAPLAAQTATGTIQGMVRDATTQRPLGSVQVHIAEINRGTISNPDGRFQLVNVPAGSHQVRFQRIGHGSVTRAVTVTAGEVASITVEMSPSAIALDEVVVTGTGGQAVERRRLGNTIASINVAQMEDAPIATLTEILQGREPGVVALPSGGLVGEGTRIRIRGTNSLSQLNEPLVYVDGIRVDNKGGMGVWTGGGAMPSRLDDIDPTSIERIEILKGAAAATLYGSEASGGVIQIFTKRGTAGEPRWDFTLEQGFTSYPDVYKPNAGFAKPVVVGGQVIRTAQEEAQRLSTLYGRTIQPFEIIEQRSVNQYLGTGHSQTLSGAVTGGTQLATYYVSARYQQEDGPVQTPFPNLSNDAARRAQGTVNLTLFPVENVNIRVGTFYTDSRMSTLHNNNNIFAPLTLAMFGKPELAGCPNGTANLAACGTQPVNMIGNASFATVHEAFNKGFDQDVSRFTGNLGVNYTPTTDISWDVTFGVDAVSQLDNLFYPFGWNVEGLATQNAQGWRQTYVRNNRQLSVDNRIAWNTEFGADFTSAFSLGAQAFLTQTEDKWATGANFPGPGFEVTGAGALQTNVEQWLQEVSAGVSLQEQIGFRNFLFLTLGARYDRHSAFGAAVGGQFYPKASISFVVSDMPAWTSDALSTVRVRAAVGQSGRQPGAFDQFTSFLAIRSGEGAGIAPDNLGSPDLRPEVSTEWEAGAELGVLQDRFALEFTYWDRVVNDVLVPRQFPVSGGFRFTQLDNIGTLAARGVEMGLRGSVVATPAVQINAFANASYIWEQITDMGGAPPLKVGGAYPRYRNFVREGYSPGAFFGPRLADVDIPIRIGAACESATREQLLAFFAQPRGVGAGWNPLVHNCGGDFLNEYLGKPTPDWQGSFGLDATILRHFRLGTMFEYQTGNFHVHNLTDGFRTHNEGIGRNLRGPAEAEATLLNPASSAEQRVDAALRYVHNYWALSPFDGLNEMEEADFIRWRELSLTYDVPEQYTRMIGGRSLAITASGRNLMLWTKYGGIDPEVNVYGQGTENTVTGVGSLSANFGMGIDAFGVPLARRFSISARVGF